MKTTLLVFCVFLGLMSCRKESNNQESPQYLTHNFDSLVVKSYDTLYYYSPPVFDPPPYYVYIPQENSVSYSFDLDQDLKDDYSVQIGHNLYSSSPHFYYAQKYVDIVSVDSSSSIAIDTSKVQPEITEFAIGSVINSDQTFKSTAGIVLDIANSYLEHFEHSGNINIGLRKKMQNSEFRYGYLNIIVDGAKVIFIKCVMNTNNDNCIVTK